LSAFELVFFHREVIVAGVGFGLELAVGDCEGVGDTFTFTPLFQTNFLPVLTQVNFLSFAIAIVPNFEHAVPGLGVAALPGVFSPAVKTASRVAEISIDRKVNNTSLD
jgi:hypothetical protein